MHLVLYLEEYSEKKIAVKAPCLVTSVLIKSNYVLISLEYFHFLGGR